MGCKHVFSVNGLIRAALLLFFLPRLSFRLCFLLFLLFLFLFFFLLLLLLLFLPCNPFIVLRLQLFCFSLRFLFGGEACFICSDCFIMRSLCRIIRTTP